MLIIHDVFQNPFQISSTTKMYKRRQQNSVDSFILMKTTISFSFPTSLDRHLQDLYVSPFNNRNKYFTNCNILVFLPVLFPVYATFMSLISTELADTNTAAGTSINSQEYVIVDSQGYGIGQEYFSSVSSGLSNIFKQF